MDGLLENTLTIVNQPKQNFHYRYASELTSTHGVITGQELSTDITGDSYPAIRLRLPTDGATDEMGNKRDFFVLCSLHCYKDNSPRSLSPHLLLRKDVREENHNFVFVKMEDNSEDPLERSWQLRDYIIVRLTKERFHRSLRQKQRLYGNLRLPMAFEVLRGEIDMDDEASLKASGGLNVCLGFTIFEKNFYTNEYLLYKETLYSANIFHGDDLKIHQLCNPKGPIAGSIMIHILIKLPPGFQYEVRLFRKNSTEGDWETRIPISTKDIFSNAAITFILPPGPITNVAADEVHVKLDVCVGRSTYKSNAVTFIYTKGDDKGSEPPRKISRSNESMLAEVTMENPSENRYSIPPVSQHPPEQLLDDNVSRDRVNFRPAPDISDITKQMQQLQCTVDDDQVLKKRIVQILQQNEVAACEILDNTKDGNTIFHSAILDMNTLLFLYRELKKPNTYKERVPKARNYSRQNLLHYACVKDRANCIRPLIGMGVAPHEQDSCGRTPLHIVIEHNQTDCIFKFQELLADCSKYPPKVKQQLIEMFKVYNHRGHTVLHAAIVEDQIDLVKVMLEFCKMNNVDILQYEVLGSGDSVVHLAARRNLVDMLQLIKDYVPSYLTTTNYAGETVLDLPDLKRKYLKL